ncbi:MAG: hypothetical protein HQL77_07575 [Magnetococcales bacterium]|nr:hypothetical protein [Magnetococcales bacterium]
MATNAVAAVGLVPLNERAVQVSKQMAVSSSGVDRHNLRSMINEGVAASTNKAAYTLALNAHYQETIARISLGTHPRPEQMGRLSVTG